MWSLIRGAQYMRVGSFKNVIKTNPVYPVFNTNSINNSWSRSSQPLLVCSRAIHTGTPYEREIKKLITEKLSPTSLEVEDISGGCGSMFAIIISSPKFKGLTPLKQQKLVYKTLGDEIHKWHGLQLRTHVSK